MNKKVDEYIDGASILQEEMHTLRSILLQCDTEEDMRWGKPAYLYNGKIVAVVQAFKKYFALLFYKGYLLKDAEGLLVPPGPNSNTGRQMRFDDVADIEKKKKWIKAYMREAIALEKK